MSSIPFPVSENFKTQTLGYKFTVDKNFLKKKISPDDQIFLDIRNRTYPIFEQNFYQYQFVYIIDLDSFVNPTPEKMRNVQHVSHDQIRLNFQTNLILENGETITPGYILDHPNVGNKYSIQAKKQGIQLKDYELYVINGLPEILSLWPVDMRLVDYNHPEFNISEFNYIDLYGNETKKTGTFSAIKYVDYEFKDKVLFWGTGLKEFIPLKMSVNRFFSPNCKMEEIKETKENIVQPVTTNYLFQTLGTCLVLNKRILREGINPNTEILQQLRNSNYYDLEGNLFKYMFVFSFTLDQFLNQTDLENVQFVSYDNVRLNFYTKLVRPGGKTITYSDVANNEQLKNRYSRQYGRKGITLGEYMKDTAMENMKVISQQCPVNMAAVKEYSPEYYIATYDKLGIDGTLNKKTSNICTIRYRDNKENFDRVLMFGSGLSETIIG